MSIRRAGLNSDPEEAAIAAEIDAMVAREAAAAMAEVDPDPVRAEAIWLLSTGAVEERCGNILDAGRAGALEHFEVDETKLGATAAYVCSVINERFPDLEVPPHSRWRHFAIGGRDLWQELRATLNDDPDEIARIRFDLAVTSVLLDAGAGPDWRYRHAATGTFVGRSEGLAIASFEAFRSGLFSSDPRRPLMADAEGLKALTEEKLAAAFQVTPENPMTGLAGRAGLLRRLGGVLDAGGSSRLGDLFDMARAIAGECHVDCLLLFHLMQLTLGGLWPERESLGGINLGDTWRHRCAGGEGRGAGLVPFHKLMQWMCYSLIEPLEDAGLRLTGTDLLTPLAEYRNGGLILDSGLIRPKHRRVLEETHRPGDEIVVEWRALTVALIAILAEEIRTMLGADEEKLPLASILEGGTWWAGRRIAAEKREGGGPPIRVDSDGTVF